MRTLSRITAVCPADKVHFFRETMGFQSFLGCFDGIFMVALVTPQFLPARQQCRPDIDATSERFTAAGGCISTDSFSICRWVNRDRWAP